MAMKAPAYNTVALRFILLMMAVAVPLAAFDYYYAMKQERRWTYEVSRDMAASAREVVDKTNDLIDSANDLLLGLSRSDAIRTGNLDGCTRLLHGVGQRFGKYTNFSVVNQDKFIVCSSGPLQKPVDVSNSFNINKAFETRAFAVSPFKFGVLTGKPILVFSLPLLTPEGEVRGTINNGLSLNWLNDYLATIVKFPEERLVVFDGDGTVLASYPDNLFDLGSSIAGSPMTRLAAEAESKLAPLQGRFVNTGGETMLAAVDRVERIPGGAYIVAFAPRSTVLADIHEELITRLALLGILVAASVIVGWVGVRFMMLNPVEKLVAATEHLTSGNLNARSHIPHSQTEIGKLAHAFDDMAEALQARTNDLANSETNYRELVESGDQLVHRFRPDTTEVFVNTALANFFGGTPREWLGEKWIDHIPPTQRRDVQALMGACTPEDPEFIYEHQIKDAHGEPRWLRWSNRAFFDRDGNITHFQAIGMDLTERKHAEAALERAMMDARNASQAKSNFLANMSHELRTPLNSIIGFSEMMSSEMLGDLPKSYHEYAGYITTSGHHLLNIINDLLDLSKIEAGVMKLEESELDLGTTVTEVATMLQDMAKKNKNELVAHLDEDKGLRLRGDRLRIKQVLLNVVNNALKFTTEGTVTVEALNPGDGLMLRISDTGIGMSDHDIAIARSPFGQVDDHHLNKRYDGTGLGLPLAEQLMEMHGGKLLIDSSLGEGTTVTLHFPLERTVGPRT